MRTLLALLLVLAPLAAHARTVVDSAGTSPIDFTSLGEIELKGAPGAIELFVARRREG